MNANYIGKTLITDHTLCPDSNDILINELPPGTRVIKPDTVVTMDFKPERLNIHVDHENKIIKQTTG